MVDPPDYKDIKAAGGNPCLEQTLESQEMCCLVETFPDRHQVLAEFNDTLELALLYAKSVTLALPNQWPESAEVMARNRRIGTSMSGIAQFISKRGHQKFINWSEAGYQHLKQVDQRLSKEFSVNESIKLTSIKPSGTVSLLAGATPGIHFPHSNTYIRRIRLAADSELLTPLQEAGYTIEDDQMSGPGTKVVEIPVSLGRGVKTLKEVRARKQLEIAALAQRHWADNQVSCTITFDPETEGHLLPELLNEFQHQLKGISFLPNLEQGAYPQMPYEEITLAEQTDMLRKLKPLSFEQIYDKTTSDPEKDNFCDNDGCKI